MSVRAVSADLTLGGNLFTRLLTEHCLQCLGDMGQSTDAGRCASVVPLAVVKRACWEQQPRHHRVCGRIVAV